MFQNVPTQIWVTAYGVKVLGCVFLSVVVIISFTHLVQEGSGCLMDYSPYSLMICIFFFISKCLRLSEAGYMRLWDYGCSPFPTVRCNYLLRLAACCSGTAYVGCSWNCSLTSSKNIIPVAPNLVWAWVICRSQHLAKVILCWKLWVRHYPYFHIPVHNSLNFRTISTKLHDFVNLSSYLWLTLIYHHYMWWTEIAVSIYK